MGVSGGSDSVALLSLLKENVPHPEKRLRVAHVNYGLRGKDSRADEEFVRELSRAWGLPCEVLRVIPKKKNAGSLQEWARDIRYGFFASLAKKEKAWGAVVAHHLEDQAETVLDRLLRGAGPRGLSGLRPVQELAIGSNRPLKVWRPLLSYSKDEMKEYLRDHHIAWREDSSNAKTLYRRNQIRHEIIPFLTKWNKDLTRKLAQTGEILAGEDAWMEGWVEGLALHLGKLKRNSVSFPRKSFSSLAVPLKRRLVRWAAERLEPRARGLSFERAEEVLEIESHRQMGPRDLGFGLSAGVSGQDLTLQKSKANRSLLHRKP